MQTFFVISIPIIPTDLRSTVYMWCDLFRSALYMCPAAFNQSGSSTDVWHAQIDVNITWCVKMEVNHLFRTLVTSYVCALFGSCHIFTCVTDDITAYSYQDSGQPDSITNELFVAMMKMYFWSVLQKEYSTPVKAPEIPFSFGHLSPLEVFIWSIFILFGLQPRI